MRLIAALLIVAFSHSALAQNSTEYDRMDFAALRDARSALKFELEGEQTELTQLRQEQIEQEKAKEDLPNLRFLAGGAQSNISDFTAALKEESEKGKPNNSAISSLRKSIENNTSLLKDLEDKIKSAEQAQAKILDLRKSVDLKNQKMSILETVIDSKLQRDIVTQNFKTQISLLFAGLVGLVIIGFFVIAYIDTSIRAAIFGGNSGIQFVTLFSLIIAIILFGLTGILADKELAALLGGLSGYILGRGNNKSRPTPLVVQ